ncbi:MAG: sulfotransferase [Gammaproteobacteria bacterium]
MSRALSQSQAAEIHRRMRAAAEAYNRHAIADAERDCARVLALYPGFPQALHLLGLCLWQCGELGAASETLARAAGPEPRDAQVMHDLGNIYSEQGAWTLAATAYRTAVQLDPRQAASFLNLGTACETLSDYAEAERAYTRALELDPRLAAAAASLAALAESANRLDDAERWVSAALALDADEPVANLTRAQLDLRAGRLEAAAARLQELLAKPLRPRNRSLALARLGAIYEKRGEYARAFATFQESKQAVGSGESTAGPSIYTAATAERIAQHADALLAAGNTVSAPGVETPAFLVGFPRSGTTLLDQILASHPRIEVLEEQDNLQDLVGDFVMSDGALERLVTLDGPTLAIYRQKYWERVRQALPQRDPQKLFIDKLPLNTLFMPLIARLFPAARFLFAVRDPRDVVLSCFMRAFGLNEAMRRFLTLAGSAQFYAEVMQVGIVSRARLGARVHLIRYEALVDDLEAQARQLCEFLALDWDPAMLHFQATARRRRINTPSYSQVVQPLYQSARARWRHYQTQLQPVLPRLQLFVEYFGYVSETPPGL